MIEKHVAEDDFGGDGRALAAVVGPESDVGHSSGTSRRRFAFVARFQGSIARNRLCSHRRVDLSVGSIVTDHGKALTRVLIDTLMNASPACFKDASASIRATIKANR